MAIRFLALIMSEEPSYILNITGLGRAVNHFLRFRQFFLLTSLFKSFILTIWHYQVKP